MTKKHEVPYPIPPRIKKAIDRYQKEGIEPGGFVRAVLADNLVEAVLRADSESLKALPEICRYVFNHVPNARWGSPELTEAWIRLNVRSPSAEV